MILSVNEKKALLRRQKELEEYEEELVRRYAQQQGQRAEELQQAMFDLGNIVQDLLEPAAPQTSQNTPGYYGPLQNLIKTEDLTTVREISQYVEAPSQCQEVPVSVDFSRQIVESQIFHTELLDDYFP